MWPQTAARTFLAELDAANIQYERIPHPPTKTALDEAKTLGVDLDHVAKTIILMTRPGSSAQSCLHRSDSICTRSASS